MPRLRGLLVLGKPAVLLQCWFAGKPIFTLWLRKERNIPTGAIAGAAPAIIECVLGVGFFDALVRWLNPVYRSTLKMPVVSSSQTAGKF